MSESDSGPGRREVAYRLFAAEFDDADFSYSESDEERAPNYVVTPTGARVNRLFAVGVLTEIESVNPEMVRGRVVDPTGAFVTYAGQYQPDALAFLERAEPPAFLALSGKARTYEPEDGDRTYTSVRPESVAEVDADTRDRWVVTAAERTLDRVGIAAAAIESGLAGEELRGALSDAGVDDRLADGVALALDHYGTTAAYLEALRELAIDAVRVVAGEREEAGELAAAPDAPGGDAAALASMELEAPAGTGSHGETAVEGDTEDAAEPEADHGPDAEATTTETGPSGDTPDPSATEGEPNAVDPEPTETEPIETETTEPETGDSDPIGADAAAEPAGTETDDSGAVEGTDPIEPTGDDGDGEAFDSEEFDPGEFELDEEERREVEAEFGTEFSTADEVEPAEELGNSEPASAESDPEGAGGDDPDTDPEVERAADSEPATEPESEAGAGTADDESESEADPEIDAEPDDGADADDVDLETAVMDAMADLDDGDGADRDALVARVAEASGVDSEAVDEAIREALMSGRCYEPADGTLKPI